MNVLCRPVSDITGIHGELMTGAHTAVHNSLTNTGLIWDFFLIAQNLVKLLFYKSKLYDIKCISKKNISALT